MGGCELMKGGQIPKTHSPWLWWIHSKDSIVLHQLELLHSQFELGKDTSASASSGEFRFLIDLRVDRFLKDLCQSIRYPLLNWLCCRVIAYCVYVRRTYVVRVHTTSTTTFTTLGNPTIRDHFWYLYYRTQVFLGSCLWVLVSLNKRGVVWDAQDWFSPQKTQLLQGSFRLNSVGPLCLWQCVFSMQRIRKCDEEWVGKWTLAVYAAAQTVLLFHLWQGKHCGKGRFITVHCICSSFTEKVFTSTNRSFTFLYSAD